MHICQTLEGILLLSLWEALFSVSGLCGKQERVRDLLQGVRSQI